jgi:hypothetical protein
MIIRFRTFLAGFLVLRPRRDDHGHRMVGTFIYAYLGQDSAIGRIRLGRVRFLEFPGDRTRWAPSLWSV